LESGSEKMTSYWVLYYIGFKNIEAKSPEEAIKIADKMDLNKADFIRLEKVGYGQPN
jgi:hypothetical protein